MVKPPGVQSLLRENRELKARLEELEETVRAVRKGADAIVVAGSPVDQVSTLQGAERHYRVLVEEMPQGAATIAPDGTLLYCNHRFAEMLDEPMDKLVGRPFVQHASQAEKQDLARLLDRAATEETHDRCALRTAAGNTVPVVLTLSPLQLDGNRLVLAIIADMSAEEEEEKAVRLVHNLSAALTGSGDVAAALRESLTVIARSTGWEYGEAWLPGANGGAPEHTCAWFVPGRGLEAVQAASIDLPAANGLPGRAWNAREHISVPDLTASGEECGLGAAVKAGLAAAAAFPVLSENEVACVLVFYMFRVRPEHQALVRLVSTACSRVGVILQRRVALEQIKEHEAELSEAQEMAHLGSLRWDVRENRVTLSEELHRIVGVRPRDFDGSSESFMRLLHPDDRPAMSRAVEQAMADHLPFGADLRIVRPDGGNRTIQARLKVVLNEARRPSMLVGVALDITQQVLSERNLRNAFNALKELVEERTAELARAREQTSRILSSITDCYYLLDNEWRLTEVNDNALKFHGLTRNEAAGRSFGELFPEARETLIEEQFRRAMEERFPIAFELYAPRVDKWAALHAYPSSDGLHVYFSDITRRKKAEGILRESEERLRFHVENSPLAVVERNRDFVVTRWSKEAETIFSWKAEETVGKSIERLNMIHPDDIPIVERTMERLSSGVEPTVVSENRNVTKDGRTIHCVWYNSVLTDADGKMFSVMSLVKDVTRDKESKQSLERTVESLRVLVSNSIDSLALIGTDGTVRCLSKRAAEAFGCAAQALEGTNCLLLVPEDQRLHARLFLADLLRCPSAPVTATLQLRTSFGAAAWFSLKASCVALGESDGYMVYVERVSENINREEAEQPSGRSLQT